MVENMEASRPEDKEMILARIENIMDFNAHIRALLLDGRTGLLSSWTDPAIQAEELARLEWMVIEQRRRRSTPRDSSRGLESLENFVASRDPSSSTISASIGRRFSVSSVSSFASKLSRSSSDFWARHHSPA